MLKREVLIAACVGKDERTYNREAEWNKMKMIMRIQAFIYQGKLTMCSTNLEQKISKKIKVGYDAKLTPGRPCLTGLYDNENSPR